MLIQDLKSYEYVLIKLFLFKGSTCSVWWRASVMMSSV